MNQSPSPEEILGIAPLKQSPTESLMDLNRRLKEVKRAALLGWPSRKDESWRYSSLRSLRERLSKPFSPETVAVATDWKKYLLSGAHHLVFLNGRPQSEELAPVLPGVKISLERFGTEEAEERLGSDRVFFDLLNRIYLDQTLHLEVLPGNKIEKTIQLLLVSSQASAPLQSERLKIKVGRGSELSLVITLVGVGNESRSLVEEIELDEGAKLLICRLQKGNPETISIGQGGVEMARDSHLQFFNITEGGQLLRHSCDVKLNASGASAELFGLSLLRDQQIVDNQPNVEHLSGQTMSRQLYKAVLAGASRSVFGGRIYIPENSQKVDSKQLNKSLVLGDSAEVDSKPQLDVFADDVKAGHGAAIGRLDPEEIFYLESRGIPKAEATAMLSRAFVEDILLQIPNTDLREYCREHILVSLETLGAEVLGGA